MIIEVIYIPILLTLLTMSGFITGKYMAQVFNGEKTFLAPVLKPVEKFIYSVCSVDEHEEMNWKTYTFSVVFFSFMNTGFLFLLQLLQGYLPLNPQKFPGVRWDTALNTAISFVTNTNWQSYGGETTMSYLTQMLGLTVQNFLSASVGIAASLAMIRGFIRKETEHIGNFWVDLTRSIIYILLPFSIFVAIILIFQGVPQTLSHNITAQTLEGNNQTIAVGPVASQIAIKQLGTNGGGFFNANSSHPFENPDGLTNSVEVFSIIFLSIALLFAFGFMINNSKQSWAIYWAVMIIFILGLSLALWSEFQGNPILSKLGVPDGMNMEGKEVRFGIVHSVLWGQITTVTSNGSVNSMQDSLLPITPLVYMFNMGIGEVIFGGLGVGLMGIFFYIVITMFIAGLMIGRTPEFLGKKLGAIEVVMSAVGVLMSAVSMLIFSAVALSTSAGISSLNNPSCHGLSEILYAYFSGAGNNGSAFAGLNANTPFYNLTIGLLILTGRFATLVPGLVVAGSLAGKRIVPESSATFPTTSMIFVVMFASVILIVGALTFLPVFALGPVLEYFFMQKGLVF
ncbi:MAG: potassium-transporting ATPase subunit KdpA [Candidatus Eremiobacterota bacterium]